MATMDLFCYEALPLIDKKSPKIRELSDFN